MSMMLRFRDLTAEDVECRVNTVTETGCSLLLYKDSRCDMNILDETVGCLNWQRSHSRENANCTVSIWDDDKKQWISKEDTGTESYTEKEKGLASDSFKRACFNWGIGRELYTAPFIWITNVKIETRNGKPTTKERFYVRNMSVVNKRITYLVIVNKKGDVVFTSGSIPEQKNEDVKLASKAQINAIHTLCDKHGVDLDKVYELNQLKEQEMTAEQAAVLLKSFQRKFGE